MQSIKQAKAKLGLCTALLGASVLLSGCVSSAINIPEAYVGTPGQPTPSVGLAVDPAAAPSGEIAGTENTLASASTDPTLTDVPAVDGSAIDPSAAQLVELPVTPATGTQAELTAAATQTDPTTAAANANQRIVQAATAPVAGDLQASATGTGLITPAATAPAPVVAAAQPRRTGILNALFGSRPNRPAVPVGNTPPPPSPQPVALAAAPVETAPQTDTTRIVATATAGAVAEPGPERIAPQAIIARASASGTTTSLPGVDRERALGINQDTGTGDDVPRPVQVASAAGLARLAPNGLRTQHAGVDVKCLKPALVRMLKTVERHYGKPAVVTSGYRSPSRNKRARGATNSLHIYCAAADIQVEGVSKWDLAKYLRSIPGRGGVGTYCHTKSVHIDIGPRRDWNWRCRRR